MALSALALAIAPSASEAQLPKPLDLRLTPGPLSISASWGISSTSGVTGFRIRWRRAGGDWSGLAEVGRSTRSYTVSGLRHVAYEVRVRALYLGKVAGQALDEATPLAIGEELPEEPTEETPGEEPEEEAPEEPGEPEEEVTGEPVWYADPTSPILSDWANIAAEPGRVTEIPMALMPFGYAYSDEVRNGDDPGGYGERAEIAEGNPTRLGLEDRLFREGQERWIAVPFVLGLDFPIDTRNWYVIMQIKQLGSLGTPILSMGSDYNGGLALFNSGSNGDNSTTIMRWSGPAKRQQLNKLLLHVKFSPNANVGFVELYGDFNGSVIKQLMGKTYMPTMKQVAGLTVLDQARLGQYRDSGPESGTAHVYYGRYVVADSREVAEAYAFE